MPQERHLAAILFTDIVGYTAIMQKHEASAINMIKHYHEVLEKSVADHHGEILNNYGDGSVCSFRSSLDALHCAIELQRELQSEPPVPLRIGLHIGEIFFENRKVLGDAVNIASRIQSLGIANSILISSEIQTKLKNQPEFKTIFLGSFRFKNVDDKVEVFALANEGLAIPVKNKMEGKLQPPKYSKSIGWVAAGLLVLILAGYFLFQKANKVGEPSTNSIAVLPFENLTNDPELEVFCDGITDEILNHLSKIKSLHVTSRTSAKVFKGTKVLSIPEIAKKLGVNYVLEGSVRKSGNQVRITSQLINALSDEHLWSEDYDYHELNDIFPVQTDVSTRVSEVLKLKLTAKEEESLSKKYTENITAYKLYLRGRNFWDKYSHDSAKFYFTRATEVDPEYALAYVGLADYYIHSTTQRGFPVLESVPIAKKYLEQAMLLDSTLSEAYTTAGFIQSAIDYDWVHAKSKLEKAIDLNPSNPLAHLFYGNLLQYTRQNVEQGIMEIKKALLLDPLSPRINWVLGRNYFMNNQYDLAYEQLVTTIRFDNNMFFAKGTLGLVLLAEKKFPEAIQVISKLDNLGGIFPEPDRGLELSYAYAVSGDFAKARIELANSLKKNYSPSHYQIARVFTALNDFNLAVDELEKAYEFREWIMYMINVDPTLAPLRNNIRFRALLKKMNLN